MSRDAKLYYTVSSKISKTSALTETLDSYSEAILYSKLNRVLTFENSFLDGVFLKTSKTST